MLRKIIHSLPYLLRRGKRWLRHQERPKAEWAFPHSPGTSWQWAPIPVRSERDFEPAALPRERSSHYGRS